MTDTRRRAALGAMVAMAAMGAVAVATLLPGWIVWPVRSDAVSFVADVLSPWSLTAMQIEGMLNVALFVPVGFAGALVLGRRAGLLAGLLGAGLSLAVEIAQSRLPGRVPDLDDVICNSAGAFGGAALAVLLMVLARSANRQEGRATRT